MSPQPEFWVKLLAGGALGYLALVAMLYWLQPRLLYLPQAMPADAPTPARLGMGFDDVRITTDDGLSLHAWYIPAPQARRVILFFHGNAGNIADRLQTLRLLQGFEAAVLMPDYRGYGRSQGRPSEAGTYADAAAAWRYLRVERGWRAEQIVIWGRSLGGAVATQLAAGQSRGAAVPGALIIESSFSSVPDLAAELYPWLPARWLSRFDYDSRRRLAEVAAPVLVIHARDDEIIPFHHGQALFAAASEPRRLLAIRGGHNGGFLLDAVQYANGVREFLETLVIDNPG